LVPVLPYCVSQTRFAPGFESVEVEYTDEPLAVEGTIPEWLSGTLVRNGPGKFEVGGTRLRHWFDGLAMVRAYEFGDGVRYTNHFLRTESYADAKAGRATGQFATDETGLGTVLGWLARLGPPEQTDNANVHVARLDRDLVAQTEVPRWTALDDRCRTHGPFGFEDTHDFDMITAHLVEDVHRGEHVGHALSFGRTHEYHLFRIPDGTRRRDCIASIPTERPAYVHSIGVSADHAILVETPLRIDLKRALSPFTEGFFELLSWDPERDTRFTVVDRDTGERVRTATVDPFFTFHVVNAYDEPGTDAVVVDLVAFEDATIVGALSFETLAEEGFDAAPPGRLVRFRIPADGTVTREHLYPGGMELPTVPRELATQPHRYAYGQATDRAGANGLAKVDTRTGTATEWWEQGLYVEEPIPVTRPDADREDEGVVIAPALDADAGASVLLVFDAETLTERARAPLPQHEPFGFHGRFFPSE
jgi:carotenoid cleavage dioxygenase-like enzyme